MVAVIERATEHAATHSEVYIMANNYLRQQDEAARLRRMANAERRHDAQDRQRRADSELRRRTQERQQAADDARRRRTDEARRRYHS